MPCLGRGLLPGATLAPALSSASGRAGPLAALVGVHVGGPFIPASVATLYAARGDWSGVAEGRGWETSICPESLVPDASWWVLTLPVHTRPTQTSSSPVVQAVLSTPLTPPPRESIPFWSIQSGPYPL